MRSGNVLLVANFASDVGYAWWLMENYWAQIANAMQRAGRKTILCYPKINTIPQSIASAPIECTELNFRRLLSENTEAAGSFIKQHQVESLYLTDCPFLSSAYRALRRAGARVIIDHDHTPGDRPAVGAIKGAAKRLLHGLASFSCDYYVATTAFVRQRMIENAGCPPTKTIVVPNGIQEHATDSEARGRFRSELGIQPNEVAVVLVARAQRIKGIDFALKCAAALPQVRFFFVGEGPDLPNFKSTAEQLSLGPRFAFLGHRRDVRDLLPAFDIGFHPSRGEVGYSLSILEMMDAGLPMLVPDLPSVSGATRHEHNGLVYVPESVEAAVAALARLSQTPTLRQQLGNTARKDVEAHYRLSRTNEIFNREVVSRL